MFVMQDVYIVGGNIGQDNEKGNVFTVPSNKYAELNMFLDPFAAKAVFESKLDIKLIPLHMQRRVNSFEKILDKLQVNPNGTPESSFSQHLLSRLRQLQQRHNNYHHVVIQHMHPMHPKTCICFVIATNKFELTYIL